MDEGRERDGGRGWRIRWDIARGREREMFFFQRGLFALALHARLSSAKRHERDAPHRAVVEIVPVCSPGRCGGGKTSCRYPARESARPAMVGATVGADRGGEEWRTRVWDTRKDGGVMVGQFPLAGEGKGVSCVVPAGRRDGTGGTGWVAGQGSGRGTGGERWLERGELSHSAVATFLAGLVGASRHGGGPR